MYYNLYDETEIAMDRSREQNGLGKSSKKITVIVGLPQTSKRETAHEMGGVHQERSRDSWIDDGDVE